MSEHKNLDQNANPTKSKSKSDTPQTPILNSDEMDQDKACIFVSDILSNTQRASWRTKQMTANKIPTKTINSRSNPLNETKRKSKKYKDY
jgi:hypothetical protein